MDMVKIDSWEDFLSLPKNKWGIPEPKFDDLRENGQLVIKACNFCSF